MTRRLVWSRAVAVLGLLLVVAGCSGIPTGGAVVDVSKLAAAGVNQAVAPSAGAPPDEIVRGFFTASGNGSTDSSAGTSVTTAGGAFAAARQYLAPDAQKGWPATTYKVVVLSGDYRVSWNRTSAKPALVTVSGTVAGTLDAKGAFSEGGQHYSNVLKLDQVGGQWRIINPSPDVVISQAEFAQYYQQRTLYFLDSTGTVVVPDQRYVSGDKLASKLMSLLLAGPDGVLADRTTVGEQPVRVVHNQLAGAELRTNVTTDPTTGATVIDLTGVSLPNPAANRALAAQIVWSLSRDTTQVQIMVGGKPLDLGGKTTDPAGSLYQLSNFQSFDPDRTPGTDTVQSDPYYIDDLGRVASLISGRPIGGALGNRTLTVHTAAMSAATGTVAATAAAAGGGEQLLLGDPIKGRAMQTALKATTITQPSFSRAGDEVWVVQNGGTKPEVYQISAAGTGIEAPNRAQIGSSALAGKGPVTALQISPDGVRVAIIAGGKLYVGALSYTDQTDSGSTQPGSETKPASSITNLTQIGTDLADVKAAVFRSSAELFVAARSIRTFRTVTRVSIDGSDENPVTDDMMNNDVDSVTVSSSGVDLYVAFGGRVYQLSGQLSSGQWITPPIAPSTVLDGSNPFYPN